MAGGIDWFRWHHGSVTDPKFQLVARRAKARLGDVLAVWAYVLEAASASSARGSYGDIDCEAVDCLLGADDGTTLAILTAMQDRDLLGDGKVSAWEKRQPKREREDDASTSRVQAFRDRKRQETPGNANPSSETPRGEESREEHSVAKATDVAVPAVGTNPENPHVQTKAELWQAAVAVLKAGGCDSDALARSFMGKLVKDYGQESVSAAVASAATAQPADAREYLKATCQRLKGERKDPVTVADNPRLAQTAAELAERERRWQAVKNDPEEQARIRAARQKLKAA